MNRQTALESIRKNPEVSVLIIGAGINGIGTFRDLALQGVDVLMVDRGDFCSGASSASSHMLHGGIRYLENAEFRLVREALYERNLMLVNAPHLAKPLPTTIPIFHWFSGLLNAPLKFFRLRNKPVERGALVIKIGLMLYDLYARRNSPMPMHDFHLSGESLMRFPKLNEDIISTATYYDAYMPSPERICMELIEDAENSNPQAQAVNYVSVEDGEGTTVTLRDTLTNETFAVQPKVVINAAGPWIDFVNRSMEREQRFIGGTKGSHLILDHPELYEATDGNEIFFENDDGRIVLIFPWMGRVMVGTTDIRIDNPDEARCTDEEVEYMLGLVDHVFPEIHVDESHILMRFSGVRPLPYADENASYTGNISRDHHIHAIEANGEIRFPVLSLVGGKWTTWRAFAEQTTDRILERLGKQRLVDTHNLGIGGGKDYPFDEVEQTEWKQKLKDETGLGEEVDILFERYGTNARFFAIEIAKNPQALQYKPDYWVAEIRYLIETEDVVHLDDILLRRTSLGMRGYVTRELLNEIADIAADTLGWSDEEKNEQMDRVIRIWWDHHGVHLI